MDQGIKQKLIDLVDELGVNFDKLSLEDQDTYEEICEILGTKAYKIYSDAFPDFDPDIQKEDEENIKLEKLNQKISNEYWEGVRWLIREEKLLKKSII